MKTNSYGIRVVLLIVSCLCSTRALPAVDRATIKKNLDEVFAYYLKDHGYWRQDNPEFKPGGGAPVAYLKSYSWGLDGVIVVDDTYALNEDGTCTQWTHNIFWWDQESDTVTGQIHHFQGIIAQGTVRKVEANNTVAEFSAHLLDGSQRRMKDRTDRSDPKKVVITPSFWVGKEWRQRDSVSWRQIPEESFPCAD